MKQDILGCIIIQHQQKQMTEVDKFDHIQIKFLIENKTTYISLLVNLKTDTLCTVNGVHRLMREGLKCESCHLWGFHYNAFIAVMLNLYSNDSK